MGAKILILAALLTLAGCGTRHVVQTPGTTGATLRPVKFYGAMPDADGKLIPGTVEVPPGTLFRVPPSVEQLKQQLGVK